ncbi:TPA: BspA family leucine-rich repeat surface protein [Listeria monocytogenes]|nr:BspA family leucine-rich repeat surface protein [Listeria monocytogenes]HCV3198506.1 BspA family leucine-rich repeat surface protein [Listeria monocytogenes]
MKKRKKRLRQLVVAFLLLNTIGLPIQNSVLANELSTTEEVVTEKTKINESATAETNINNSEDMESETAPISEKESEPTEISSSETLLEESKLLTDTPKVKSSENQESSKEPSSTTQQREERPSTKAVTSGAFPNGSTATWQFDDTTGTLTISGGTLVSPNKSIQDLTGVPVSEITNIVFEDKVFASGSCKNLFYQSIATNLDLRNLDTSNVTIMSYMFEKSAATSLDVSNFDTSKVTDMTYMFSGSAATSIDMSNFDTSKVKSMRHMFSYSVATSLDVSSFDTSNVSDLRYMFYGSAATSLNLSNFDTSNATTVMYMFGYSAATSIDVSDFDTSSVTNMYGMFSYSAATSLDVSNFDTSKVTTMTHMFSYSAATSLDLSDFDTSNVIEMPKMFEKSAATSLDVSNFDTSKVTNMKEMFRDSAATSLDLSNFDTSNVVTMMYMFYQSAATSLDLSNFDTSKVTTMQNMFVGVSQLQNLTLGSQFQFLGTDAKLSNPTPTAKYTGKWQNIGSGTVDKPKGSFIGTATELMSTYDGSTMADTYVWQPTLLEVDVQDSVLMVGDTWNPEDNFLSALDNAENPVDFKDITVTGSVDTTQPGVTTVDYSYGGMTSTATITVLETMPASWINFSVDGTNVRSIPGSALSTPEWNLTTGLWDKWNPGTVKVPTDKVPSEPTKQGYEFKGWKDTAGTIVDFNTLDLDLNSQNEFDFYAAFEKEEYTVTFDVEGNQEQEAVLFDELIKEPTVPNKAEYAFTGWYDAPTGGNKWDFSTDKMPDGNVTLYARFNKLGFVTPEIKPVMPNVVTPIMPGVDPLTPSIEPPSTPGGEGPNVVAPTTPEDGGSQRSSNDSGLNTVNTGNTMITSQKDIVTSSPATSQENKLAKLGENSSLLLQGFGVLMVLSGVAFFLVKRRKMHS